MTTSWLGAAATDAKKKRKHKPKRAKPNAFGCLEVGDACKSEEQCCSGICEGKTGKKRCRAHGAGTCAQGTLDYCASTNGQETFCNSSACRCLLTTSGSAYCASGLIDCEECRRDADCVALGYPPGSACAPFSTGVCAGECDSGMVCMAPCGYESPEP